MEDDRRPGYDELTRRLAAAESALQAIREGQVDTVLGAHDHLVVRLAEAEAREGHIKQVLQAIRRVNQLIASEPDLERLIAQACETLTSGLGYHNAWIALLDRPDGTVTHAACAGLADAFEALCARLRGGDYASCMRRALAEDGLVAVSDPQQECLDCPLACGYADRAGLVHRLAVGERVYGVISVSVPARYAEEPEERQLFAELARDLGHALRRIETEQARRAAQRERDEILGSISDAFFALDEDLVVTYWNEAAARMTGLAADALIGRPLFDAIPEARGSVFEEQYRRALGTKQPATFETYFEVAPYRNWYDVRVYPREHGIAVYFALTTERHQAEAQLRRANEIIERSPAVAFVWRNAEGWPVDYVSENVDRLFGWSAADFYSGAVPYARVVHPQDMARVAKEVRLSGENPAATTVDHSPYRILRADGTTRWVEDMTTIRRAEDGTVTAYEGILVDITPRIEAEEALRERAKELRCINAISRDVQADLSRDQVCRRAVGHLAAGMQFPEITVPIIELEGRRYAPEGAPSALSHGLVAEIAVRGQARGRLWVYYSEERPFCLPEEQNMVNTCAEVLSTWIARIEAQEALAREEARLRASLYSIGDAVICTDVEGRAVRMNAVAERLTGWREDEALGRPLDQVFRIVHEHTHEPVESPVETVLRHGSTVELANHTLLVSRAGTATPIADSGAPIRDASGEIRGVVLVFRDQTEERHRQHLVDARLALITFAGDHTLDELHRRAIREACTLLSSDSGAYHTIEEKERPGVGGTLCAECLAAGAAIVRNDPSRRRELAVPVIRRDEVVAVLCVFGKRDDYDARDVSGASYLADVIWQVTRQKRAEEALRDSEERYRLLAETTSDIILLHDMEGRITYVNQAGLDLGGATPQEAIGRSIADWLPPDRVADLAQRQARRTWGDPSPYRYETAFLDRRGAAVPVEVNSTPIVRGGEIQQILIVARDIRERKRAEANQLRQQRVISLNHRIAQLFLTAPDDTLYTEVLAAILDTLRSEYGYFGHINEDGDLVCPSMVRDVWDRCQMPEKSIVFPQSAWGGLWGRSLIEQKALLANEGLRPPHGHVQLENALVVPILHRDQLIGQFAVANKAGGYTAEDQYLLQSVADQTAPVLYALLEEARQQRAREELEEQLRQALKMEAIGRLAGGVAHDFNNMLTVILGHTDLALHETSPNSPLHADLEQIRQAAQRSANLTQQLLAFARRQTVLPRELDLNQSVASTLDMLRRMIGENVALRWEPAPNLWRVRLDPTQLDQILTNLVVNARDAIAVHGEVVIRTANRQLDAAYCAAHPDATEGDHVELSISDNGSGMDEETLSHLFEPFFTTKDVGEGTGLGLSTVYGIVRQNKGSIAVESAPGRGTTFTLLFPRHVSEAEQKRAQRAESSAGERETVLFVDDEEAILRLGVAQLERMGYRVLSAIDPLEALELARSYDKPIDLLMSDLVMPGMDGRQLARELLALYPHLKVLFTSGHTADVIANHGVSAEVDFIAKPYSRKQLEKTIRAILDRA